METKLTQGDPLRLIVKFTIPLLLGNIIQQLYNICDVILVGKYLGPQALAAVGATGTLMFLVLGLSNGMVTGFTVLTSQTFGADDDDGTKVSVTNGFYLCVLMISFMTTVSLLSMRGILKLMNTPEDIFDNAYIYITTICAGSFAMVFNNYFASLLRAIGNSKAPLCFMFGSAVLNIVLDIVFIVTLHWGVRGAAVATVISQAAAALASAIYLVVAVPTLVPQKKHWRINKDTIVKQVKIGIPMSLQNGITASGTAIQQSAINSFGSIAVTAVTASNKVQDILTQGMFTVGQSMAAYSGQNYGCGRIDRIRSGLKAALKLMVGYSVVAVIIVFTALRPMLTLFFDKGTDISIYWDYARTNIWISMCFYVPLAMIFIYRNTIQACNRGFRAMLMGVCELGARVVMAFVAIGTGVFALAASCNGFAWFCAGVFGCFSCYRMLKGIEAKEVAGS